MRRARFHLALLAALATSAAAAKPDVGAYACVTHRAVGLQGGEDGPRFAGRIKLPDEEQRFIVKIARTEHTDDCKWGERAFDDWYFCKTSFELTFSKSKAPDTLRGDNLNVFVGSYGNRFHIFDDLTYVFSYRDLGGNYYLEEGECTAM